MMKTLKNRMSFIRLIAKVEHRGSALQIISSVLPSTLRHLLPLLLITLFSYHDACFALTGPTWLFTVPTAQTLNEGEFTIGLIYADIGFRNEVEAGIHGLKFKFRDEPGRGGDDEAKRFRSAIGVSWLNLAYMVTSASNEMFKAHIGFKLQPYFFFVGVEVQLSDKDRLIVEANNGIGIGIRRRLRFHWMAEAGMSYSTFGFYRSDFYRSTFEQPFKVKSSDFKLSPILGIYYSDVF